MEKKKIEMKNEEHEAQYVGFCNVNCKFIKSSFSFMGEIYEINEMRWKGGDPRQMHFNLKIFNLIS